MKLDAEGRIMLSADFIEFAKLDETALYAGIGRSFQIWLPDRYRSREANARARAKTEGLPSLRLVAAPHDQPTTAGIDTAFDTLHHSVLLQEVVDALGSTDGHYYLDATFAMAAIAARFLNRLIAVLWPSTVTRTRSNAAPPCRKNLPGALFLSRAVSPIWRV